MQPTDFNGMNCILNPPPGMTEEECIPLAVMRTDYGSCVSAWKPNQDDLAKLCSGGWIFLHVFSGHTQPPVALVVDEACPLPVGE